MCGTLNQTDDGLCALPTSGDDTRHECLEAYCDVTTHLMTAPRRQPKPASKYSVSKRASSFGQCSRWWVSRTERDAFSRWHAGRCKRAFDIIIGPYWEMTGEGGDIRWNRGLTVTIAGGNLRLSIPVRRPANTSSGLSPARRERERERETPQ
ncbi:hypothetical protein LZ30DRAFT_441521 [Colletotrichum cereale]|nr:hypothetical protein LZ30DRAFT_441521 [Colletotrichum cereale]